MWRRRVLTLAVVSLSGCYQYSAAPASGVPEGAQVRARILDTYAERLRLQDILGFETRTVTGEVIRTRGDTLQLLVAVPPGAAALPAPGGLNQRLFIPLESIAELEIRRLDRTRTVLLGSAGLAAMATLLWVQFTGWFGGDTTPTEPPKEFVPSECCVVR